MAGRRDRRNLLSQPSSDAVELIPRRASSPSPFSAPQGSHSSSHEKDSSSAAPLRGAPVLGIPVEGRQMTRAEYDANNSSSSTNAPKPAHMVNSAAPPARSGQPRRRPSSNPFVDQDDMDFLKIIPSHSSNTTSNAIPASTSAAAVELQMLANAPSAPLNHSGRPDVPQTTLFPMRDDSRYPRPRLSSTPQPTPNGDGAPFPVAVQQNIPTTTKNNKNGDRQPSASPLPKGAPSSFEFDANDRKLLKLQFAKNDGNRDGRLDLTEFLAAFQRQVKKEKGTLGSLK